LQQVYNHRAKTLPPHFHTTADIRSNLVDLVKSCDGVELKTVEDSGGARGSVALDYLHFKPKGGEGTKPKLMIFANEHAREMITAEAALSYVKDMCKSDGKAAEARNLVETLVVVNANPYARTLVENGDFCKRSNPNQVDINRNWDDKFGEGSTLDQTAAGASPFSEPETRLLKRIVEDFKPTAYFSLHSGFKGILYANRFGINEHKSDLDIADSMFTELNKKYCDCPQGPADVTLSYHAAGTSLDWVADKSKGLKLSVAFEMWPNQSYNPDANDNDETYSSSSSGSSFLQRSETSGKSVAEMTEEEIEGQNPDWCLRAFNPVGRKDFDATVSDFKSIFSHVALSLGQNSKHWQDLSEGF
jgi:hypothetical protein